MADIGRSFINPKQALFASDTSPCLHNPVCQLWRFIAIILTTEGLLVPPPANDDSSGGEEGFQETGFIAVVSEVIPFLGEDAETEDTDVSGSADDSCDADGDDGAAVAEDEAADEAQEDNEAKEDIKAEEDNEAAEDEEVAAENVNMPPEPDFAELIEVENSATIDEETPSALENEVADVSLETLFDVIAEELAVVPAADIEIVSGEVPESDEVLQEVSDSVLTVSDSSSPDDEAPMTDNMDGIEPDLTDEPISPILISEVSEVEETTEDVETAPKEEADVVVSCEDDLDLSAEAEPFEMTAELIDFADYVAALERPGIADAPVLDLCA